MSTTIQAPRRGGCGALRLLVAGAIAATCVRVWLGPGPMVPQASAQIPDAGLQRREVLAETRRTNQLLEQILRTLQTGTIQVRLEGTDNSQEGVLAPRTGKPK